MYESQFTIHRKGNGTWVGLNFHLKVLYLVGVIGVDIISFCELI